MLKSLTAIFLVLALSCPGQVNTIKVYSDSRAEIPFPWAGGMNTCQFGKIDLDLDGTLDLVAFDRTGDRILPFKAESSGGNHRYVYAPGFAENFPALSHWAIFADYNLDGKVDIFTYSPGFAGMKVFRNTSQSNLEFRLEVYPFLTSFQGGGDVNILVTYVDLPAIVDLDGDGDLDILTFWGLGSFVEKHTNLSMEKYGTADSLDYEKTEVCWGYFAESEETNAIALDTCLRCGEAGKRGSRGVGSSLQSDNERHTGSTFCVLDLNGDGLKDLLLGDVDYPNLVSLYNGGNAETARMTSYDWQYPPGSQTVDLFSMPAAFYEDFDFDGVKDLLVAPFDPNPVLPENFTSNWLYHNQGSDDDPVFSLQSKSFLQNTMLDFGAGAYPAITDITGDGLPDIVAGNFGYYDTSYYDAFLILHTEHIGKIALLENSGALDHPAFTFTGADFAGLSSLRLQGLAPAFGDLDNDGDQDMLVGTESGQIMHYENIAGPGARAEYSLVTDHYQGIDPGAFSTPFIFDLDRDGLPDLVAGEKAGNLNLYLNTGNENEAQFTFVTDSLGKINVTDYNVSLDGYSVPYLFQKDERIYLFAGSEQGRVFFYPGIENAGFTDQFSESDTLARFLGLETIKADFGLRSAAAVADIDQDGIPDMVAGNFSGGLEYYSVNGSTPVNGIDSIDDRLAGIIKIHPNPATDRLVITTTNQSEIELTGATLFDILGRPVPTIKNIAGDQIEIITEALPRGIYFLVIDYSDSINHKRGCYSQKVILH